MPGADTDVQLHSGWRLRHFAQGKGQRVIEIYDASRDLVAFVASTMRPLVSIDAAWRGHDVDVSGKPQWWALAVGHVHRGSSPLVTFGRRSSSGRVRGTTVAPDVLDGLWVAMVPGRQASISLCQGPHWRIRRVSPTYCGRS